MKKHLMRLLLVLCMVTAMFSTLTVGALAANTVSYQLKAGDTVASVCKNLGIDFPANREWIKKANNITDFTKLRVGRTLVLPEPGTVPDLKDLPSTGAPSTGTGSSASGNASTGTGGGTQSGEAAAGENDFVSEYLISHTMVAGETVSKVCSDLGINFSTNSAMIKKLNNITDFSRIPVGRVVLLPADEQPQSGSYLRIMAHKIVSGETATTICQSFGISYSNNIALLKTLNNKNDLSSIKAGQIFYVPVPGGSSSTGGSSSNGSSSSTGSPASPSEVKSYKISFDKPDDEEGKISVDSSAKAGSVVTVTATPAKGYRLCGVIVTGGQEVLAVTMKGNVATFTMPKCDVYLEVFFVAAKQ